MNHNVVTLLDADRQIALPTGELRCSGPSGSPGAAIRWTTLRGGLSEGVQVVEIDSGCISFSILPTRGMGLWRGRLGELPIGWKSPVERPVNPSFVNLTERNGLGWLHGFNELLCRCGLGFNGPPGQDEGEQLTLHGRIANLPAHQVTASIDGDVLTVQGVVDEASMFGTRLRLTTTYTLQVGGSDCSVTDEITNLAGKPTTLSLLYHINVGRPFLEPGGRFHVAFQELAPRDPRAAEGIDDYAVYAPPDPDYAEQAYFFRPLADSQGWSTAVLENAGGSTAFAVHFNTRQLPYFTVWKNTIADADGFVTGLEPSVNFPNFRSFEREQGRLPLLPPGATYRSELRLEAATTPDDVRKLVERVRSLQETTAPTIHRQPQPTFSPAGRG